MHIPLSGRNPMLHEVLGIRPHLLVLNKMDLADLTHKSRILELLEQQGLQHVLFTECLKDENIKKLVPILTALIKNSQRYQRAENVENSIMVIGVPNVGKSSIINSVRKLHLKKRKSLPSWCGTRYNQSRSHQDPGAIHDHLVGVDVIADYLLYVLNQQQQFRWDSPWAWMWIPVGPSISYRHLFFFLLCSYVERYGLSGPCDDVESVLKSIALHLGKVQKIQVLTGTGNVTVSAPNYNAAACEFIHTFRKGLLGKVMLDQVN
ncbi:mitochondrial ribosome-associated GTPase 1 isoform 3-T3 [Liasis olivaceus]